MMKLSLFPFIVFYLFAVSGFSQEFNSIKPFEATNSVSLKKDTAASLVFHKDTIYGSNYLPGKEMLRLASLPLDNIRLTSGYGYRIHPIVKSIKFHNGIDLSARHAMIYSVLHGTVIASNYDHAIGNYVTINHGYYETTYGHLSERLVNVGELVKAGSVIGISGQSGLVTGEHLHFIVRYKGQTINPLPFLSEILLIKERNQLIELLTFNK
ncbi:M23 family metallopeptidase [Mucilaginibacter arboris]|uniref:Peptidoglycan DD-metalloendopeptidase family protein n=1 Tax=Mucilaginibacter arboris TaxID=2682090 RepID=A0A7K1T0H0_9SPHI|nr:M23 family metallopeptidase [Mucilaginibacter arboris]MVN23017.1 peptidoglycan DD-metalloendopeptidase family protein [Mucilaginibacter arboris]